MAKNNILSNVLFSTVLVGLFLVAVYIYSTGNMAGASIQGNDGYTSTTTDATWTGAKLVKTGQGLLGSVVITGNSNATIRIYDATTTDITLRGNKATSTITIAQFPTSVAGTYTFDVAFTKGLIVEPNTTVGVASSTITLK